MPFLAQEAHGAGGPWCSGSASYNAGERMPLGLGRDFVLHCFNTCSGGCCCPKLCHSWENACPTSCFVFVHDLLTLREYCGAVVMQMLVEPRSTS